MVFIEKSLENRDVLIYADTLFMEEKTHTEYSDNIYDVYRVTYNGDGIYEALKKSIDMDTWSHIVSLNGIKWLPKLPQICKSNYRSYFTKLGYTKFCKDTLPIIIKYLDVGKIKVDNYHIAGNVIYSDQYQLVIDSDSMVIVSESALRSGYSMFNIPIDIFLEATTDTYIIRDKLYPVVEMTLDNPNSDRKFKQAIGNFIDRNNEKLRTPGPQYLIPVTDGDKEKFFEIFGVNEKDIISLVVDVTSSLNGSDFKYLRGNPIFWLFFCCIRYYTIKKDSKGLNTTLAMYALLVYPSIFHKYFKYEVSSPGVMAYTIDQLTNKFIIKQQGHIFGALTFSIQQSFKFLRNGIEDGSDKEAIRFIQRIRNDQNSMIKKLCDQYTKNHAKGLSIDNALDSGENGELIDSYVNDTSQVEMVVQSIVLPLITNGINLKYVEACAKMAQISISEVRFYLTKIITNEEMPKITKFIESILFLWLYDEKKTKKDINSSEFLVWSAQLFRKTNSNNTNIVIIKDTLNYWGELSGLHKKFNREASRINYKKAIFFYFILMIQYYNH